MSLTLAPQIRGLPGSTKCGTANREDDSFAVLSPRDKANNTPMRAAKRMETGMSEKVAVLTPAQLLGPLNDVESRYAPRTLYVAGKFETPLPRPRVALVGSRRASPEGLEAAGQLARHLAQNGVTVVSGLADGIDTAAHWGTIKAAGRTIAVLGTPLDRAYPAKNASLQNLIMREHCAVSQFQPRSEVHKRNFVERNLTMALIANASVVVEAGETSGSLHQAVEALRLGRPLFIWKKVFENRALRWPKRMLDYGAIRLEKFDVVLDALPPSERVLTI